MPVLTGRDHTVPEGSVQGLSGTYLLIPQSAAGASSPGVAGLGARPF